MVKLYTVIRPMFPAANIIHLHFSQSTLLYRQLQRAYYSCLVLLYQALKVYFYLTVLHQQLFEYVLKYLTAQMHCICCDGFLCRNQTAYSIQVTCFLLYTFCFLEEIRTQMLFLILFVFLLHYFTLNVSVPAALFLATVQLYVLSICSDKRTTFTVPQMRTNCKKKG